MVSEEQATGRRFAGSRLLAVIGPGLVMAATGVGAGDLAGAAFAGSKLGVAVLWAVILGAGFKLLLTEGFAKWQLATGTTILEGSVRYLGLPFQIFFTGYLLLWSFTVGSALISACGVSFYAILPLGLSAPAGRFVYGLLHSLAACLLVLFGRYQLFEKVMGYAVGFMFAAVLLTAVLLRPDLSGVLSGIFLPSIPSYIPPGGSDQGVSWTLALMGGVGGTLTILCYGYWIREKGWEGPGFLRTTRIDLLTAYSLTGLFGMSMVLISSHITLEPANSSMLIVALAGQLESSIGVVGRCIFLAGAWAAMFTSLLGVWQSVPYLFADFWGQIREPRDGPKPISRRSSTVNTSTPAYRGYLLFLTVVPLLGTLFRFETIQKTYAVFGSLVIPAFAVILLYLNNQPRLVGPTLRNRRLTNTLLAFSLGTYLYIGLPELFQTVRALF